MTKTKLTTPEEAIDFFVKLTEAVFSEPPSEADHQTLRAQAAQVVDGFQSLAVAFRLWSEAPDSSCPNHLTQTFLVSKADGSDDGCVEIVLRRVRPGGDSFAALMADALRAKAIRAAVKVDEAVAKARDAVVEAARDGRGGRMKGLRALREAVDALEAAECAEAEARTKLEALR